MVAQQRQGHAGIVGIAVIKAQAQRARWQCALCQLPHRSVQRQNLVPAPHPVQHLLEAPRVHLLGKKRVGHGEHAVEDQNRQAPLPRAGRQGVRQAPNDHGLRAPRRALAGLGSSARVTTSITMRL
jgi:hypothetical protein